MHPIVEFADGMQGLCEQRIEVGRIRCLFAVIRCSFANDGILCLLQEIESNAVDRNHPLFLWAAARKFAVKFPVLVWPEAIPRIPSVVIRYGEVLRFCNRKTAEAHTD